jgi:hypothetical protein
MAKQPFLSNMRVATGIYALNYVTPAGRSVDIPLNPGEPIPGPQLRQYEQEYAGYFAREDAYFIPMFSGASNLAPFGLPPEFERVPHFARLLYRDGRVKLFTPPKVLWDDVVNRRATLAGLYSAAGIIWRQTTVPERKRVYYLQKGQELLRIEGLPFVQWYVMPDGCRVHLSEIDQRRSYHSTEHDKTLPYTLAKYMIANLCQ